MTKRKDDILIGVKKKIKRNKCKRRRWRRRIRYKGGEEYVEIRSRRRRSRRGE